MICETSLNVGILYLESKGTEWGSLIRGRFAVEVHCLTGKWRLHGKAYQFFDCFHLEKWVLLKSSPNNDSESVHVDQRRWANNDIWLKNHGGMSWLFCRFQFTGCTLVVGTSDSPLRQHEKLVVRVCVCWGPP